MYWVPCCRRDRRELKLRKSTRTWRKRSGEIQTLLSSPKQPQPLFHIWPFCLDDGIPDGVTGDKVGGHAMGPENAFELCSDAFEGGAGAGVAGVGVEADAKNFPGFESVRKHEELGFGIGGGADGRRSKPGISNFARVGMLAAVARVSRGPGPSFDVPEAGGADDGATVQVDNGIGDRSSSVAPGQCGIDIGSGLSFCFAGRDSTGKVQDLWRRKRARRCAGGRGVRGGCGRQQELRRLS